MDKIFRLKAPKKSRKYPIKKDETGKTARRRAFEAFDKGMRPAQVSRLVDISFRTACRYFTHWKRLPGHYQVKHARPNQGCIEKKK